MLERGLGAAARAGTVEALEAAYAAAGVNGERIAVGIALDLDRDCGICNVGTKERARRRGMGTAVTAARLHAARDRSCGTASIQS